MANLNLPQTVYIVITFIIAAMFAGVLLLTFSRKNAGHFDAEGQRIIDDEDDAVVSGSRSDHGAES